MLIPLYLSEPLRSYLTNPSFLFLVPPSVFSFELIQSEIVFPFHPSFWVTLAIKAGLEMHPTLAFGRMKDLCWKAWGIRPLELGSG